MGFGRIVDLKFHAVNRPGAIPAGIVSHADSEFVLVDQRALNGLAGGKVTTLALASFG